MDNGLCGEGALPSPYVPPGTDGGDTKDSGDSAAEASPPTDAAIDAPSHDATDGGD